MSSKSWVWMGSSDKGALRALDTETMGEVVGLPCNGGWALEEGGSFLKRVVKKLCIRCYVACYHQRLFD